MQGRRDIESAVGHRTSLDVLPGGDGIRVYRSGAPDSEAIVLDRRGAEIVSAYLASVISIGILGRAAEELEDAMATVLSAHDDPAPLVRISQQDRILDVAAPSWDAVRCEINLLIPRLHDMSTLRTAH